MTVIDLTHPMAEEMPVFPGMRPPSFSHSHTHEKNGFCETDMRMLSHTGTHVDAPLHMLPGGAPLDRLPAAHFLGKAVLVNLCGESVREIGIADLAPYAEALKTADFLIIKTGWSTHWGQKQYFSSFPVLSPEATRWTLQFRLKGIGIDAISIDAATSADYPNHRILLDNGVIIVENLNLPVDLPVHPFLFSCLPLRFPDADGSPVRAVAIIDYHPPTH